MIAGPPVKPSRLRLDSASREALTRFLSHPRYEVLPTEESGDLVMRNLPTEVTITVTSSPRRGIEATLALAERLAAGGYAVVPHLAARLITVLLRLGWLASPGATQAGTHRAWHRYSRGWSPRP